MDQTPNAEILEERHLVRACLHTLVAHLTAGQSVLSTKSVKVAWLVFNKNAETHALVLVVLELSVLLSITLLFVHALKVTQEILLLVASPNLLVNTSFSLYNIQIFYFFFKSI